MHRTRWILAIVAGLLVLAGTSLPTAVAAPGANHQTLITVHPVDWRGFGPHTSLLNGLDVALLSVTAPGDASAAAAPDLPTAADGRRMRLVEVQLCYDATAADVTLTEFLMLVHNNTTGTTKTNPVAAAVDLTDRNDEACRSYPVDWVLGPGDMAAASVSAHFDSEGPWLEIGRLTFVLEPTNEHI